MGAELLNERGQTERQKDNHFHFFCVRDPRKLGSTTYATSTTDDPMRGVPTFNPMNNINIRCIFARHIYSNSKVVLFPKCGGELPQC